MKMSENGSGAVQVVVVGSIGLDTVKTPFESRENQLGGSVSYACSAASFFTEVGMVGVVGQDFPEEYARRYDHFGIDTSGLKMMDGKTFRWSGVYHDDMINRSTLSTELNVFESFMPELPESYRDVPFLLLGNISPELQLHVFKQAKAPRFVVADTMDLWINIARDALVELIGKVNMLALNDSEAALLTGETNLRKCAERILAMGPEYLVIKKGEHGAMLFSANGMFIVPAYPVAQVKDPTGAGDSFAGGFLGALARVGSIDQRAMKTSLLYGSVVASCGVEDFSLDSFHSLTNDAIEARLAELKQMMSVD